MTKENAEKLVKELESLIGDSPSRNERRLDRCRDIVRELMSGQLDAYLREKASTAQEEIEIWFSPRKWQRAGSPEQARHFLLMAVKKLEYALDTSFQER
jgi:hypothetical protein